MNKKKVAITVAIVTLIIVAVITGFMIFNQVQRNYTVETVSDFKYYITQKEGKYGVIDGVGNTLIEPTYEAIKIPNPSKPVFICIYEYNAETGDYKTKALNEKGETIFGDYEEVNAIQIKEIVSDVPYEKSVLRIKKKEKYGLIDFNGAIVVEPIYDELDSISYKEGELLVKKEDKYGVINIKGTKLVDLKYDSIEGDNYYSSKDGYKLGGYIVGNRTDEGYRYGYLSRKGQSILKMEYNKIYRMTEISDDKNAYLVAEKSGQAGLYRNKRKLLRNEYQSIDYDELNQVFTVSKNKKFGVINREGKEIVPIDYDNVVIEGIYIYASKEGENTVFDTTGKKQENLKYKTVIAAKANEYHIVIDDNDQYGIEDKQGNLVVPNQYLYLEYTFGDYFIACGSDGKLGMINTKNEKVIDLKYDVVQRLDNTKIIQTSILETSTIELYNKDMKQMVSIAKGKIKTTDNYVKIYSDTEEKYFSIDGQEKKNTEIFPYNILFSSIKDGKWGFIDKEGNMKVDYIYDRVTEFNSYGFAGIKKGNKWGVIDRNKTIVLEPTYTIDDKVGEPEFIGKYYKVVSGYGEIYYTDELKVVQYNVE